MIEGYLKEVKYTIDRIDVSQVQKVIDILSELKGRLFIVGNGGGAGNASHAVCDFRKLCEIDACTFDNVSELTARINDEGWNTSMTNWLAGSKFNSSDCLFVLSVGGGDEQVSVNIHSAILYALAEGAKIVGIVGRDKCSLTQYGTGIVVKSEFMTPIVEGMQSILIHMIVTKLQKRTTVW